LFFCRPASVGVLAFEHDSLDEPIVGKELRRPSSGLKGGVPE
jgi:hypothetical protein